MSPTGDARIVTVHADARIPFPEAEQLACHTRHKLFAYEDHPTTRTRQQAVARAKAACSGCPVVTQCLKWALANPELTRTGVWAATTARERTKLRIRLQNKHGLDWIGVVAEADRVRTQRLQEQRYTPPDIGQQGPPPHPMCARPGAAPRAPDLQASNQASLAVSVAEPSNTPLRRPSGEGRQCREQKAS